MNEVEIRKTFEVLKQKDEIVEIRIINGKATFSGYFKDINNLIGCIKQFEKVPTCNIYFVLNPINDACYDREQCERVIQNPKASTSDGDITGREWLLIDIDPVRSSGVSASDEEKENAKRIALSVYDYLRKMGFNAPVSCDSGNGWHLLYKIKMFNDDDSRELIKSFLNALDMMFSDDTASVDVSVFNASRITKLYGTVARKGNNSKNRPHRESKILRIPDEIKVNKKALLQKVIDEIPVPEEASYKNNYGKNQFDIDEFISKHGIRVNKVVRYGLGRKIILDECVFDSNHKAPDSCIFVMNNGAIGYKCFHNSCQNKTWKDVRNLFEPTAYDKKAREYKSQRSTAPIGTTIEQLVGERKETAPEGEPWIQFKNIEAIDRSKIVSIPSGFKALDRKIIGFNKGEVSVWSGKNGSGKSSVLNIVCLNAAQRGFKCAIFSGELTKQREKQWLQTQAAGRQNVLPTEYENLFFVQSAVGTKIDDWLYDKVLLYNNDFGNKFENVLASMKELCEKHHPDTIVLDNLMALDILTLNGDKYQQQTTMILALTTFAKTYGVHLHIVCHPRKAAEFLRKDDISGTADLTNAVDNVFIVHRVGQDFMRLAKDFYGEMTASKYYEYDNVVEVCKNRDLGVMDLLVGLFFERESKRFLNEKYENICYGWEESPLKYMNEELTFIECDDLPFTDGDLPY